MTFSNFTIFAMGKVDGDWSQEVGGGEKKDKMPISAFLKNGLYSSNFSNYLILKIILLIF